MFAYGTTGSGKTHTMVGIDSNPGIMVLFLDDIFLKIKEVMSDLMIAAIVGFNVIN